MSFLKIIYPSSWIKDPEYVLEENDKVVKYLIQNFESIASSKEEPNKYTDGFCLVLQESKNNKVGFILIPEFRGIYKCGYNNFTHSYWFDYISCKKETLFLWSNLDKLFSTEDCGIFSFVSEKYHDALKETIRRLI